MVRRTLLTSVLAAAAVAVPLGVVGSAGAAPTAWRGTGDRGPGQWPDRARSAIGMSSWVMPSGARPAASSRGATGTSTSSVSSVWVPRARSVVHRAGTMAVRTQFDTSYRYQDGKVRDLRGLVTPTNETLASDINDAGVIVGASVARGFIHAFSRAQGTMTDLGTLGGTFSGAVAVNGKGQIVGTSYTAKGVAHVVIWQGGRVTDLGVLGAGGASPGDINDKGQIVGSVTTAVGRTRAFVWTKGVLTKLAHPLPGGDSSSASGINEKGEIVGASTTAEGANHAVLWSGGTVRDLGTLGGTSSAAVGISDTGLIAGNTQDAAGNEHAVVWTR